MSQSFSSPNPMQPLSIGNVVTAGVRLYRSNLKTYLRLALFAYLWILVPIYGWAKFAAISGLISRLAFGELVNQPESVSIARSKIKPRLWLFFIVGLRVGFFMTLIYVGLLILGIILGGIVGALLGLILGSSFAAGIGILTIVFIIVFLFGLIWFYSRWMIAEVPLAVEDGINATQSVERSWELTKTSTLRIQGVLLIAFAIALPVLLLFNYLPQIFLIRTEAGSTAYWTIYLISRIISLVGGILVMPFWQAIKAVLYYDLRTRREGLGLRLRDRNI